MPSPLHNGGASAHPPLPSTDAPPPSHRRRHRLNLLVLLLRLVTFGFSLAAAIFTVTNSASPSWLRFHSFRFVFAANAIVAAYSLFETFASTYEIVKGTTLFPERMQLLFDFAHDQVFAYMVVAAGAAGAADARRLRAGGECAGGNGFCVQEDVSVALGFAGFTFLALASLVSGFRLVCYFTIGSRLHIW